MDPHRNIFYYYKAPQKKSRYVEEEIDYQIENNVTKAFINLLEFCTYSTQNQILQSMSFPLPVHLVKPTFKLQICSDESVPDALIEYQKIKIIIESKVHALLDLGQLKRHYAAFDSTKQNTLLVLTNNQLDKDEVEQMDNTKFFTWNEITQKIWQIKQNISNEKDLFLLNQFIEFMEVMGLSPFLGFKNDDFDSFLNIEQDPTKEKREAVKKKFKVFSEELFEKIEGNFPFEEPKRVPIGNLGQKAKGVWSAIFDAHTELPLVQTIHYSLYLTENGFNIELWAEGKIPTRIIAKQITLNPRGFTEMCRKLDDHKLRIDAKEMIAPRKKKEKTIVELETGKYFSEKDTEFILEKIKEQKLFQFAIRKIFPRDYQNIGNKKFIEEVEYEMKQLIPAYEFLYGKKSL